MGKNIEKHYPELLLQAGTHSCSATFSWGSGANVAYSIDFLSGSIYYLPGASKMCDYKCLFVFAL